MKKGSALPLETIVILVLVTIVAVSVVIFFTVSQSQSASDINQFGQTATGDTNVAGRTATCNIACATFGFADTTGDNVCDNSEEFCTANNCPEGFKCNPMSCTFTPCPAEV